MRTWLKEARKEKKLTQLELAQAVGVTEQYIYYIESGDRTPSVEIAKNIANVLGFDWTLFFPEPEESTEEGG